MSQPDTTSQSATPAELPLNPPYFFFALPPLMVFNGVTVLFCLVIIPFDYSGVDARLGVLVLFPIALAMVNMVVMLPTLPYAIRQRRHRILKRMKGDFTFLGLSWMRPEFKGSRQAWREAFCLPRGLVDRFSWLPTYYYGGWAIGCMLFLVGMVVHFWRIGHPTG